MTGTTEQQLWDSFTHSYLRKTAHSLWNHLRCSTCDMQDYLQDLRINLWHRQQWFDPERGRWTTFVRLVTTHQASELQQRCRRAHLLNQDSEAIVAAADVRTVGPAIAADQRLLCRDLQRTVGQLNATDQEICRLLSSHSVSDAARQLHMPRSTLVDRMTHIRRRFEAVHLDAYL